MMITFYRCYWPTVYEYLKPRNLARCVEDTFGYVLTINLDEDNSKRVCALLPAGAIVDIHNDHSYNKELSELQDILRSYTVLENDN